MSPFARFRQSPAAAVTAAAVLLALVLRTAAAWRWGAEVADDVDLYRGLARSLLAGDGYALPSAGVPTAFRPPLVPLLYAALGNVGWAIVAFQVLAGAATAGLTVRLAGRLGLGWKAAGLAGAVVACDPILLRYTPRAMTEVTAALLTAGLLCRLCSPRSKPDACVRLRSAMWGALLTGVLFGLCALCRPTVWAFGGLLAAGWAFDRLRGRAGWLHDWKNVAAAGSGVLLVVGPWVGRNAAAFGRPVLMTTHGGYTLHLANNATFYDVVVRGEPRAVWEAGGMNGLNNWQGWHENWFLRSYGLTPFTLGIGKPGGFEQLPPDGWRGPGDDLPPGDFRRVLNGFHPEAFGGAWVEVEREDDGDAGVWLGPPRLFGPARELARDRYHRDRAVEFVRSDPAGFARAIPVRIARFWGPAPLGEAADGLPAAAWWAVCGGTSSCSCSPRAGSCGCGGPPLLRSPLLRSPLSRTHASGSGVGGPERTGGRSCCCRWPSPRCTPCIGRTPGCASRSSRPSPCWPRRGRSGSAGRTANPRKSNRRRRLRPSGAKGNPPGPGRVRVDRPPPGGVAPAVPRPVGPAAPRSRAGSVGP